MSNKTSFAIGYLNIDSLSPNERRKLCLDTIKLVCDQFLMIRGKLYELQDELANYSDLNRTSDWCIFLYEDFIYRKYVIRERMWDYLQIVLQIPPSKNFLKNTRDDLSKRQPDILESFDRLQHALDEDIPLRNVSIHETFLFPLTMMRQSNEEEPKSLDNELEEDAKKAFTEYINGQILNINEFNNICMHWLQICNKYFEPEK